ncbi:hypothetical protein GGE65_005826 [Skermanella aerolata]|uniref:hypothetical protein n=1 Tax=Skermanella aerolata TaxID=393310 RepID=UPI003D2495BC
MSISKNYTARFSTEHNVALTFDAEGVVQEDQDSVCLSDMLSELLDEMGRRGFDVESASFSITRTNEGRLPASSRTVQPET